MSISNYLTLTSITERKYLNRYAKRKEYIKEHGEEPSSTLQEDLNDSEDNPAYFVEQIEISRCDSIHLYFINLLSDKLDRYPERYKCVEDLFDLSDSYNLLSNFNQFYFFLTKKDIEEVLESISFDLTQEGILRNLSTETKNSIDEFLKGKINFDEIAEIIFADPLFDENQREHDSQWIEEMRSLVSFFVALLHVKQIAPELKKKGEIQGGYYHYWF